MGEGPGDLGQLQFGLRLGDDPRAVITTTPSPCPLSQPARRSGLRDHRVRPIETVPTLRPLSSNGSSVAMRAPPRPSELHAELLGDIPAPLWRTRCSSPARSPSPPIRTSDGRVAVDPPAPTAPTGRQRGSRRRPRVDGLGYVLADRTCRLSPEGWAAAPSRPSTISGADRIVAEKNYGGDMVRHTIQTVRATAPVSLVTASRGKISAPNPSPPSTNRAASST